MRRLLLFDVDGTLVHVGGAGREALRAAMRAVYGETGDIDAFDFHGRTDPAIVRGLLRATGRMDADIDRGFSTLWDRYCALLERELRTRRGRLRVLPGVTTLLERLAELPGIAVGLVTGNVEGGARRKLRACGLDTAFGFGAYGSDSELRAELPPLACRRAREITGHDYRSEEVFVIGDTPHDIECARASGVRAVAVATGRHTADELGGHAPDAVLADLRDPLAVLEALSA